jgi:hypothetical protein
MSLQDLFTILNKGIFKDKVAYRAFPVGNAPELPFICYLETDTDNFFADNSVYKVIQNISVELYTNGKDPASELALQSCLDDECITWQKSEIFIDDENMNEVIYDITLDY